MKQTSPFPTHQHIALSEAAMGTVRHELGLSPDTAVWLYPHPLDADVVLAVIKPTEQTVMSLGSLPRKMIEELIQKEATG
jgi:hypothetical protein